jgi:hypothetical protein
VPSIQLFVRIYVVERVVHEGLCGRVSGSRGSMWPIQWIMRVYVGKSVVREDLWYRVFSGS